MTIRCLVKLIADTITEFYGSGFRQSFLAHVLPDIVSFIVFRVQILVVVLVVFAGANVDLRGAGLAMRLYAVSGLIVVKAA